MPSSLFIRTRIKQLNRLDPDRADFGAVRKIFGSITDGMRVKVGKTAGHEVFFRGRVNPPEKPARVEDLEAPPAHVVTGFQRCNPPGEPLFYAASRRLTALLECDVSPGDRVFLSQWMAKEPIPVNRLLHDESGGDDSYALGENEHILHPYLDTIFTRRVHKTFSNDYKFTAAISMILMCGFKEEALRSIRPDGFVGLKYPSVADIEHGHNTAMHPSFAKERLTLLHVMEMVVQHRSERHVVVSVEDNAVRFHDGRIEWAGDINLVPDFRPPDGGVLFIFDGGQWLLKTIDGELTESRVAALLEE